MFTEYRKFRSRLPILLALSLLAGLYAPCATALPDSDWSEVDAMRDTWQRPAEVMDAMGATAGSVVADIGAGDGYFTFRLAERVGLQGKVYAVEVRKHDIDTIRGRAKNGNFPQVEAILGTDDDPHLPDAALDAILLVKTYNNLRQYNAMLQSMFRTLKPGGKLVIIDEPPHPNYLGKSREEYFHRHEIPENLVREDVTRNGFRFINKADDVIYDDMRWYFLIFEKPKPQ